MVQRLGNVTAILLVGCIFATGSACAPPQTASPAGAPRLFVANAGDGTVTELLTTTGALAGPPVAIGPGLEQLAVGPLGSLFVVSREPESAAQRLGTGYVVTQLVRQSWGAWTRRTVQLGSAGGPISEPLLAAGGGRWAALAFRQSAAGAAGTGVAGSRCGLVLIDGLTGAVTRKFSLCRPGETVSALAVDSRSEDAVVYVAFLDQTSASGQAPGRLIILAGRTGETMASAPLWGTPMWLGLAPAHWSAERLVFSVVLRGGPELDPPEPYAGRLMALHRDTLVTEAAYPLDAALSHLAFSSAGDTAYALDSYDVVTIDLRSGQARRFARLPERGLSLAVDAERVYVAAAYGSTLETIERANGMRGRPLTVGRGPVVVTLHDS